MLFLSKNLILVDIKSPTAFSSSSYTGTYKVFSVSTIKASFVYAKLPLYITLIDLPLCEASNMAPFAGTVVISAVKSSNGI